MKKLSLLCIITILSSCRPYDRHDVFKTIVNRYSYYCESHNNSKLNELFLSEFHHENESCKYIESMNVNDVDFVEETNATAVFDVKFTLKYLENESGKWNEGENQRQFHFVKYNQQWKIKTIK